MGGWGSPGRAVFHVQNSILNSKQLPANSLKHVLLTCTCIIILYASKPYLVHVHVDV